MRIVKVVWFILIVRLGWSQQECGLKALDGETFEVVERLTQSVTNVKMAERILNCLKDPCDTVKQGLVLLSFKLKNSAQPAGALQSALLTSLEPERVAKVWQLFPQEARLWCIKAFIESLECTVANGKNECQELETNAILEKFTRARTAYTDLLLVSSGLEPFPELTDTSNETLSSAESMTRYAHRLKIEKPASEWLIEQFTDPKNESKLIEPSWFSSLAPQCRIEAFANVTDLKDDDNQADAADLDAAARIARFAWFYKSCHRHRILAAYDDRENIEAQEELIRQQLLRKQEDEAEHIRRYQRAAQAASTTPDGPIEEL